MTYFKTLRAKHDAEATREARIAAPKGQKIFRVLDERGLVVGNCISRVRAERFIADSLNSSSWTIA